MTIREINTPEDLRAASKEHNPVNIAGYGRESTHKGYLSYILNPQERWNGAEDVFLALVRATKSGNEAITEAKNIECEWEQRLGKRRKVDLLVSFFSRGENMAVPVELKTDRGPSGDKQFEELSKGQVDGCNIPLRLVLLLGAASVQDFKLGVEGKKFVRLKPTDIVKALTPLIPEEPKFLKDWVEAVKMEAARRELAHEVYRLCADNEDDLYWQYGYRSESHLMYYVLDRVRDAVAKHLTGPWELYSGGYNTVLNLQDGDKSWIKLRDINASAFFEFNDDWFVLKIWNKEEDKQSLKKWLDDFRKDAKSIETTPEVEKPGRTTLGKTWLSVVRWKINFHDLDKVGMQVQNIINQFGFGQDGLLSNYV
jgi:hypothetical protein